MLRHNDDDDGTVVILVWVLIFRLKHTVASTICILSNNIRTQLLAKSVCFSTDKVRDITTIVHGHLLLYTPLLLQTARTSWTWLLSIFVLWTIIIWERHPMFNDCIGIKLALTMTMELVSDQAGSPFTVVLPVILINSLYSERTTSHIFMVIATHKNQPLNLVLLVFFILVGKYEHVTPVR